MNVLDFAEDPGAVEAAQIQRRMQLAQMIASQGMNGAPVYSNKAAVAKALQGMLGSMEVNNAEKAQRELAQRRSDEKQQEMAGIIEAAQAGEGKRGELAKLLAGSKNPAMQQAGLSMMMKGPGKLEKVDLGDKIGFMDESGRIVREIPKGVSPDTRFGAETVKADTRYTHDNPSGTAKLTDERTRSEGAANRGVQLAGQAAVDRRAGEANAIAADNRRAATDMKGREDIDGLRKEFYARPEVKNFNEAMPVLAAAKKAPDTPQGDLALVYGVGKVLDPNSVVREGEMGLVLKSGSIMERLMGSARVNFGKGRLTPEVRQRLTDMLEQRVGEYKGQYDNARASYEGIAKQRGYDSSQIFTEIGGGGVPRIQSDADYAALPSGATFVGPDGKTRRKP
jgi:hypothetical protein